MDSENNTTDNGAELVSASWQAQDGVLRDLWIHNKTPQEIAEALGRSVAAIMTRAARLGLPRRSAPGRKPGSRRVTDGSETRQARAMPRQARGRGDGEDSSSSEARNRICLMCLTAFPSQGRHNWICSSCKGTSEYQASVALADIHFPI